MPSPGPAAAPDPADDRIPGRDDRRGPGSPLEGLGDVSLLIPPVATKPVAMAIAAPIALKPPAASAAGISHRFGPRRGA